MVVGEEGTNGGLWCSPVAKTSRPTSSTFCAMRRVDWMRSPSVGVYPVVGSVVTSPTVKMPNCMLIASFHVYAFAYKHSNARHANLFPPNGGAANHPAKRALEASRPDRRVKRRNPPDGDRRVQKLN
jgi:hypothetical protein